MNSITMKAIGRGSNKMFVADTFLKHELCPEGMANYVTVPKTAKSITLVTSNRETSQCFDIRPSGRLVGVGLSFDSDLYRWFKAAYNKGDRYVKVEYPA